MVPIVIRKSMPVSALGRRGFTLIEMLVVIAIIGVLAGLVVFAFPSFTSKKRAGNGASQLQGWLFQAKMRAFRDGAGRGLRLYRDTTDINKVLQCQYVEVPDDFTGGNIYTDPANPPNVVILSGVDIQQGYGADTTMWLIQGGDILEIQGGGLPHRIVPGGIADLGGYTYRITLQSAVATPLPAPGTPHYRVMGSPRPVGEAFNFPDDVAIDLATNVTYGNSLPNGPGYVDMIFGPSGKLISPGVTSDFVALWVRDVTQPTVFEGNPALIAVHVRSGLVAGSRPAPPPAANPYQYIIDGRTPD